MMNESKGWLAFGVDFYDCKGKPVKLPVDEDAIFHVMDHCAIDPEFVYRELMKAMAQITVANIKARAPVSKVV